MNKSGDQYGRNEVLCIFKLLAKGNIDAALDKMLGILLTVEKKRKKERKKERIS
jgi:hypothetical protein